MDITHTQLPQPELNPQAAPPAHDDAKLLSAPMHIERTTTPDGRMLLLYTFEDPDE